MCLLSSPEWRTRVTSTNAENDGIKQGDGWRRHGPYHYGSIMNYEEERSDLKNTDDADRTAAQNAHDKQLQKLQQMQRQIQQQQQLQQQQQQQQEKVCPSCTAASRAPAASLLFCADCRAAPAPVLPPVQLNCAVPVWWLWWRLWWRLCGECAEGRCDVLGATPHVSGVERGAQGPGRSQL
jgi:hypothetical protein